MFVNNANAIEKKVYLLLLGYRVKHNYMDYIIDFLRLVY